MSKASQEEQLAINSVLNKLSVSGPTIGFSMPPPPHQLVASPLSGWSFALPDAVSFDSLGDLFERFLQTSMPMIETPRSTASTEFYSPGDPGTPRSLAEQLSHIAAAEPAPAVAAAQARRVRGCRTVQTIVPAKKSEGREEGSCGRLAEERPSQ